MDNQEQNAGLVRDRQTKLEELRKAFRGDITPRDYDRMINNYPGPSRRQVPTDTEQVRTKVNELFTSGLHDEQLPILLRNVGNPVRDQDSWAYQIPYENMKAYIKACEIETIP